MLLLRILLLFKWADECLVEHSGINRGSTLQTIFHTYEPRIPINILFRVMLIVKR